jgi:hypothetical protein
VSTGVAEEKWLGEAQRAQEALADLQSGIDNAKDLVERARFLLAGGSPPQPGDALVMRDRQATREPSSDTVQKPAGE